MILTLKDDTSINHVDIGEFNYITWIDNLDRQHISGKIGKDIYGTYVTAAGYRIYLKDGLIDSREKAN